MTTLLSQWRHLATRLHDDERGEIPVGPILMVAFIVVPLVLLLIIFKDEAIDFARERWDTLMGQKGNLPS